MTKTVRILGTDYKVRIGVPVQKDPSLEGRFGYCSYNDHRIVIADLNTVESWKDEPDEVKQIEVRASLRHEVIHASLYESGLHGSTSTERPWAMNEEMVDWMALQFPKIIEVFQKLDCTEV